MNSVVDYEEVEKVIDYTYMVEPDEKRIRLFNGLEISQDSRLSFILGPCALESEEHALCMAEGISEICMKLGVGWIFKSSFDKGNRTSLRSYRGPGLYDGLDMLQKVRDTFEVPVLTDVHESWQCELVAEVVDILQIPAFLARQTDLVLAAANTLKPINVKKPQFSSPGDMKNVIEKIESTGNTQIILTERGTCFGYTDLIFDLRSIILMRKFKYPVAADVTHSTQRLGGGTQSGGNSRLAPYLARAAIVCGADVIFAEVHDDPSKALSDGECQIPLAHLEAFLKSCIEMRSVPMWEDRW